MKTILSQSKISQLCLGLCALASSLAYAQHSNRSSSASQETTRGESWATRGDAAGVAKWNGVSETLVVWDECKGRMKGGYNDDYTTQYSFPTTYKKHSEWNSSFDVTVPKPSCTKRPISSDLLHFMNDHFPACVAQASGTGMKAKDIVSINLGHVGVKGDDRHRSDSKGSYHNISRAIDVTGFIVKFSTDRTTRNYNHSMAAYAHYKKGLGKKLTKAEDEQLKFWNDFNSCIAKRGGGTISFENAKHQGHIHVSLPSAKHIKAGFYRQ